MSNENVYISILFVTAEMFWRESAKLESEMEADRAYPFCCVDVGPKLENVVLATKRVLNCKLLFSAGIDDETKNICAKVIAMLEHSADPLLKRMGEIADVYADVREESFITILDNLIDCRPFREALDVEYKQFLNSRIELRNLIDQMKQRSTWLGSLEPNREWVPSKMTV